MYEDVADTESSDSFVVDYRGSHGGLVYPIDYVVSGVAVEWLESQIFVKGEVNTSAWCIEGVVDILVSLYICESAKFNNCDSLFAGNE